MRHPPRCEVLIRGVGTTGKKLLKDALSSLDPRTATSLARRDYGPREMPLVDERNTIRFKGVTQRLETPRENRLAGLVTDDSTGAHARGTS